MNDDTPPPLVAPAPSPAKKRGCFFYGCLTSIILMVVFLVGALIIARVVISHVNQYVALYTETNAVTLPKAGLPADEIKSTLDRVTAFSDSLDTRSNMAPLILTGPEVNALLATRPELAQFKDQFYVSFQSNQTRAQISIPLDKIKVPGVNTKGRYLNGSGTFNISINDGRLDVSIASLEVKGKPVPPNFLASLQRQNLAANANSGADTNVFSQIESLQVTNGTLVILGKNN